MVLFCGAIAGSELLATSPPDEIPTRITVRVALANYALAVVLILAGRVGDLTRALWTVAWASYLAHLFSAFHFYHHWSHACAVAHTEEVSGFGPGIYFSHLFTLLWTVDVAYWWWKPERYLTRACWIGWSLHGYMALIIFNATVIYETGFIRWVGAAMFGVFGFVYVARKLTGAERKQANEITSP
jgi:hypothetical protein